MSDRSAIRRSETNSEARDKRGGGERPDIESAIENTRREISNTRAFLEQLGVSEESVVRYLEMFEERLRQQLLSLQRMQRDK